MLRILRSVIFGLSLGIASLTMADEISDAPPSDTTALRTLFGDDMLSSNVRRKQIETAHRSPQERWELLQEFVLPSKQPHTFRVVGRFLTTHPAGESQGFPHEPRQSLWKSTSANEPVRVDHGGVVVSPVLDLIETARELGRLAELEHAIKSRSAQTDDEHRNRLALLFLTALARDDIPAVTVAFDAFIAYAAQVPDERGAERWPEVLVLQQGLANLKTRAMVGEWATNEFTDIFDYSPNAGLDVMNDHIRSLTGIYHGLRHNETASPLPNWIVDSFVDSSTRAQGRPIGCWQRRGNELHKLSGHESDWLTYRVPLRGNYQIECDYTTGAGTFGGFIVAGRWLEMDYHQSKLETGTYRKYGDVSEITPKLGSGPWGRFRAVIEDRHLQTFFNGRLVHEERLPAEHNPWFTFRSWRRSHPTIKNFRITGTPTIPDEILLTSEADMPGWVPYYEHGFGANLGFWSAKADESGTVVVQGYPRFDVHGAGLEKWLRYHRPMIEDGTIEYEFFYQKDLVGVHPALGRLAFLLEPDGVHTHWITDGRHETTGLDPFNVRFDPKHQRGPEELPLIEATWNRLQLTLEDQTVRLSLNGVFIFERPLEATNQREFGLFHYADRTEALVKNVVWRGDWPTTLPEDNLVDPVLAELDRTAEKLPNVWRHDFKNGAQPGLFDFNGDATVIRQVDHGIVTTRTGEEDLHSLSACLELSGDFDVVVRFEDLKALRPDGSTKRSGVGLQVGVDSASQAGATIYRRTDWNGPRSALVLTEKKSDGKTVHRYAHVIEESTSGRLRLARRGDRIYALYAEGDSPNFRLVGVESFSTAPLQVQGIRCLLQAGSPEVRTVVTWNELVIRAERIFGRPIEDQKKLAAELNERRDALAVETIDFTTSEPKNERTIPLSDSSTVVTSPTEDGVRWKMTSNGDQKGIFPYEYRPLGPRTVDVELALDVHQITTPDGFGNHTEVALELILPFESNRPNETAASEPIQPDPYKITCIVRQKSSGRRWLVARVVSRDIAGHRAYLPIRSVPVESPDRLRFVVDQGTLYFLYSESDSDEWNVLAKLKVNCNDFSAGIVVAYAYADTLYWTTDVTWKTLTIATKPAESTPEEADEP